MYHSDVRLLAFVTTSKTKGLPMPMPQNYQNHVRRDPPFHFFILPVFLLNFIIAIYHTIRHWPDDARLHIWWIIMAFTLFLFAGISRTHALRAQNRIIRLEERLRLANLLPAVQHDRIPQLTTSQLIALRFASDQEVAALAIKTLDQNLDAKTIKQAIVNWRPDYERV
jgi:hypothetical protein